MKEDPNNQLYRKRDEVASQIRRREREDKISKRRNLNADLSGKQTAPESDHALSKAIQIFLQREPTLEQFRILAQKIHTGDIIEVHEGIIGIRKLLSVEGSSPIQEVIDTNLVPKMIDMMKHDEYPRLQMQAAWALTNVASGTSPQCQSIIDKGGVPLFVNLLSSPHINIIEQAVWALGNISGDNHLYRDLIIKAGGIKPLIHLAMNCPNLAIKKQSAWALSNLCRGAPNPKYEAIKECLPVFMNIIANPQMQTDVQLIIDCTWALSYMTSENRAAVNQIISIGVERLILFLKSPHLGLLMPTLRTIGNICYASDNMKSVLACQPIPGLLALMDHDKKTVRREACWVLSNIAAGSREQVYAIMNCQPLVAKLLQLIRDDSAEVRREICFILGNLSQNAEKQDLFKFYVHYGVIKVLAVLLRHDDPKVLDAALEAIYKVLFVGEKVKENGPNVLKEQLSGFQNTLDVLEQLQYHKSNDIYDKVTSIVKAFFEIEDPLA